MLRQFNTFTQWINKAPSWIGGKNVVCIDTKGRFCWTGKEFMRARDEDTFPVRWFREGITPEELSKHMEQNPAATT